MMITSVPTAATAHLYLILKLVSVVAEVGVQGKGSVSSWVYRGGSPV